MQKNEEPREINKNSQVRAGFASISSPWKVSDGAHMACIQK